MPFDVAGTSSTRYFSSDDSEGRGKKMGPAGCGCCMCIASIICLGVGFSSFSASWRDDRGKAIAAYKVKVSEWTSSKGVEFASLGWSLNHRPMRAERYELPPPSFGETKPLFASPEITDYRYVDYAACPGGVNKTCQLKLVTADGKVSIDKSVVARMQVGPTPHLKISTLCQWYDGDLFHPMAAVGFGACNNDRRGGVNPQTYNYGPNRCVLDHYLDGQGCPNDVIPTKQLVNLGWTWATQLSEKKRFQYDNGKCWDYTDCHCRCDTTGSTFKTDATAGYGFTGYGYYAGGKWTPFAKAISAMSSSEKAQQCRAAFSAMGAPCASSSSVSLICFRAGGYPKRKCSTFCAEQDSHTAVYRPPATFVSMNTLYGPWGAAGTYPSYTNVPGHCTWNTTRTQTLSKVRVFTDASGQPTISTVLAANDTEAGSIPFPLPAPPTVEIEVEVDAVDGPRLTAARATNGCNLEKRPSHKCFGETVGELLSRGVLFVTIGSVLIGIACCCCCFGALRAMFGGGD